MSDNQPLTREAFLSLARQAGFDPKDPHLEALRPEVETLFGTLRRLRALDHTQEDLSLVWREDLSHTR